MNIFKSMLTSLRLYDEAEDIDYLIEEELIIKDPPYPLMNQIKKRKQKGFSETLLGYCDQSSMKDSQLYKRARIDRKHFSKIRSNLDYRPTKNTVFAFIIALELPLEEAHKLLLSAGYSLSDSFEADIIISYYVERGVYDIDLINEMLYRRRLNTI